MTEKGEKDREIEIKERRKRERENNCATLLYTYLPFRITDHIHILSDQRNTKE